MARIGKDLRDRSKKYAHRTVDVAEAILGKRVPRAISSRIIDQLVGAGTSVGANVREADEAVSRKDFTHALGIVLKELSESRYWLEFVGERGWIAPSRLASLEDEGAQLSRIFSVIVARTKRNSRPVRANP